MPITTLERNRIGWKKVYSANYIEIGLGPKWLLVKLRIPAGAKVRHGKDSDGEFAIKCRATSADVLGLYRRYGKQKVALEGLAKTQHSSARLRYKTGEIVLPHLFSDQDEVCAGGIHFFWKRSTAARYDFT